MPSASVSLGDTIRQGARDLREAGIENAASEAKLLFLAVSGYDRAGLIAAEREPISPGMKKTFEGYISRRVQGEPSAYITGYKEFWSLRFKVTPDVLIPRPETEGAVEAGLALLNDKAAPRILDVGTGSGAILISLLDEINDAQGVGADISEAALYVARDNARANGVDGRSTFIKSDYLSAVSGKFDLIVSNPPYIDAAAMQALPYDVKTYEPHLALAGGQDGLDAYRTIIEQAPAFLKPGGAIVFEIGYDQGDSVPALLATHGFTDIAVLRDLAGHNRIVKAIIL